MNKRCGKCFACRVIESTKRIVSAECRPAGPGVDDLTVKMWNRVLEANPCENPVTEVEIRVTRRRPYEEGCPGHRDLGARQGHYFMGDDFAEALSRAYYWFLSEYGSEFQAKHYIDIQWWGDDPRRGQVIE